MREKTVLQKEFDVAVIGGGPGGSSAASYLAKAGLSVVVFEREIFPREHVGESLVPASTRVLREIGIIDRMDEVGFVRKYGAVWTASADSPVYEHDWDGLEADCHAEIRFAERDQEGVDRTYTWHVDRGKFDKLMLEHAEKLGATVYQGYRIREVDFSGPHPVVHFVHGKNGGSQEGSVKAKVVVDASGRLTFLGNQLKLKKQDDVFNQYAIHTWFDNFDRKKLARNRMDDYIFIHFLPVTNSWIWQIPITDTVTSIGVVTQKKNFQKSGQQREQFFWDCIKTRPELYDELKKATQMRPLKDEGDYSYSMSEICGDGFVMIGDAARFVDPIFSSGVSIALTSARFATADIIAAAKNGGVFTKDKFENYKTTIRRGTANWYEFISLYYRLNVLFTAFVEDPRYRLDVLKLLQGDLYEEEKPPVLIEMARVIKEVENRPNHPWHKLLGDMTGDLFKPAF